MKVSINGNEWWYRRIATRRLECLPLLGWLTAGVMVGVYYLSSRVMPKEMSLVIAMVARLLLTGATHENGFIHFVDGFAMGGNDRQKILTHMKSTAIGAYGAIAFMVYSFLLYKTFEVMTIRMACMTIAVADPYAKMLSAQLVMMMPHASTEGETSSPRAINIKSGLLLALQGLLPLAAYAFFDGFVYVDWEVMLFMPAVVMYFLYYFIWRRLRCYTPECGDTMFLLVEMSVYLAVVFQLFIPYR